MNKRQRFVFVGNIPLTTTDAILKNIFKACGSIEETCIRCSAGAAILSGKAHANRTPRDRQYATVKFNRSKAVPKALALNGTKIHGMKIIVCLSAAQLPEVKEIVNWRVEAIKERKGIRMPKPAGYRGLMPTPTEPIICDQDTQSQTDASTSDEVQNRQALPLVRNFMFWGMTFPKTIM